MLGVGQTGDIHAPLVPGKSDIDLFILCSHVPDKAEREARYCALGGEWEQLHMEVCHDEIWGFGDIFDVAGIDVMPMFFCVDSFSAYIDDVLAGNHVHAEGRFYPIGRLATVESLHVFSEKSNTWSELIARVAQHPRALFDKWFHAQSSLILDEEDLSRVLLRKEVLFTHQVLENALDHFLQALYALNNFYFPSRKRAEVAIDGFSIKPCNCKERLLKIVENTVRSESIEKTVLDLQSLTGELRSIARQKGFQ